MSYYDTNQKFRLPSKSETEIFEAVKASLEDEIESLKSKKKELTKKIRMVNFYSLDQLKVFRKTRKKTRKKLLKKELQLRLLLK